MDLKERTYSALVVSAAEKLNTALSELLEKSRCRPVKIVSNVSAAKRCWNDRSYDFVIINSPLPDDPGIRFAIDLGNTKNTVVMIQSMVNSLPTTISRELSTVSLVLKQAPQVLKRKVTLLLATTR
ncbi:MAG: hypothetical protein J6P39_04225, partial [Oscillospiraceae bacterium]|nr:hypothetical protein [Oscillospiraceae bacterium]